MPKHRRSEIESSLAYVGAPVNTGEFWPEAVGYGQAAPAGPVAMRSMIGPASNDYFAPNGYDAGGYAGGGYGGPAYDGPGGQPDYWAPVPDGQSWQEWQNWQNWGPPPELHPDHPSAPVPRIQFPADHPSGPMPAQRDIGAPELPKRRPGRSARSYSPPRQAPDGGDGNGSRPRLYAVPDDGLAVHHTPQALRAPEQPSRRFAEQRSAGPAAGPGWQESTDYRRDTGPFEPPAGRPNGRFQDIRSPSRELLWTAEQVLTLADGQAAQIAHEAEDYATAIRQAAEREAAEITKHATTEAGTITQQATSQAAAIRGAAEREAADLRARIESMSGDLGRVVAAYITQTLANPAMPMTAPEMPLMVPVMPATAPPVRRPRPALPGASPDAPGTDPDAAPEAMPDTRPGTGRARPATTPRERPAAPAGPKATPAKKPQAQGRQRNAMRIATAATATLLSIGLIGGVSEIASHGLSFFVFRAGATGESGGSETDQQFLAQQAAAQHPTAAKAAAAAPKGHHHKKTLEVHHT